MLKSSNIHVPVRIATARLLPLLAFTGFTVEEPIEKRAIFSPMQDVAVVVEATPMISRLVADLQAERGPTAAFVEPIAGGREPAGRMRAALARAIDDHRDWKEF
jgi:hypothetical protein